MNIPNTITSIPLTYPSTIQPQLNLNFLPPTNKPLELGFSKAVGINPLGQYTYSFDPNILATFNAGLDYTKLSIGNTNSILTNTDSILPFQINQKDLKSISFDTILDQPHSIKSLFSEEVRDLVKNLLEIQKNKLATINTPIEALNDMSNMNSLSDSSRTISLNTVDTNFNPNLQINHLLNNSQSAISQNEKPSEKSSKRPSQFWEEQSETPYSSGKKKEGKSLAKSILFSIGKNLEKISKAIQDVAL